MYRPLKLFGGSCNPALTEDIAESLGVPLGQAQLKRFADSEVSFQITENVRGADVFVVQPTAPPVNEHLVEMLVMIDAFKRASAGRITAVLPYYGYAPNSGSFRRESDTDALAFNPAKFFRTRDNGWSGNRESHSESSARFRMTSYSSNGSYGSEAQSRIFPVSSSNFGSGRAITNTAASLMPVGDPSSAWCFNT